VSLLLFGLLVGGGAFCAGLLGALTGLGGGVVIVPLLTLALGVDLRYAIGASLVSVIATSSGSAAAYVREGFTNIRIGMVLEVATTVGALSGALAAGLISARVIAVIFGVVLLYSAAQSFRRRHATTPTDAASHPWAEKLRLHGTYPAAEGERPYGVQRLPLGLALMYVAGVLSGLLGIGSGAMKVIAMDEAMLLPFKVSTTTSNFMIGVTAAASAGIYFHRGYIDPALSLPVMLGVLGGALVGARVLTRAHPKVLRVAFAAVILVLGVEMIAHGVTGRV
jgi:uncharacterized membrane protein YfcA